MSPWRSLPLARTPNALFSPKRCPKSNLPWARLLPNRAKPILRLPSSAAFLVSMLTEPDTAPSGYAVYGGGRAFNQLCETDLHARRALRAIHSCQAVYAELARIKLITTEIQTGQRVAFAAKLSNGSVFFGYGIH